MDIFISNQKIAHYFYKKMYINCSLDTILKSKTTDAAHHRCSIM